MPLHELPGEEVKFLLPSRFCPSDKFGTFVENEFGGLEGGARVAAMRDWIEANLEYVRGSSDAETTVIDTFIKRQGICRDYAHLMVTLARASNIPARAVCVYAPDATPPDFHAVAEVSLDGAWYLVDATGMASARVDGAGRRRPRRRRHRAFSSIYRPRRAGEPEGLGDPAVKLGSAVLCLAQGGPGRMYTPAGKWIAGARRAERGAARSGQAAQRASVTDLYQ